jgi:hypothetical protein
MRKSRSTSTILVPLVVFVAAMAAIIIGITKGEVFTVLQKATLICLECIGLG